MELFRGHHCPLPHPKVWVEWLLWACRKVKRTEAPDAPG